MRKSHFKKVQNPEKIQVDILELKSSVTQIKNSVEEEVEVEDLDQVEDRISGLED
jgi:hypothetical protein